MRQRLRQRQRYQLDSIVPNGVIHTSTCGSSCGNGATSKKVPTPAAEAHYIVRHFATAIAAQNGIQLLTLPLPQPLPYRVNGP